MVRNSTSPEAHSQTHRMSLSLLAPPLSRSSSPTKHLDRPPNHTTRPPTALLPALLAMAGTSGGNAFAMKAKANAQALDDHRLNSNAFYQQARRNATPPTELHPALRHSEDPAPPGLFPPYHFSDDPATSQSYRGSNTNTNNPTSFTQQRTFRSLPEPDPNFNEHYLVPSGSENARPTRRGYIEERREQELWDQSDQSIERTPVYQHTPKLGSSGFDDYGQSNSSHNGENFTKRNVEAVKTPKKGLLGRLLPNLRSSTSSNQVRSFLAPVATTSTGGNVAPKAAAMLDIASGGGVDSNKRRSIGSLGSRSILRTPSKKEISSPMAITKNVEFAVDRSDNILNEISPTYTATVTAAHSPAPQGSNVQKRRSSIFTRSSSQPRTPEQLDGGGIFSLSRGKSFRSFRRNTPPTPPVKDTPPELRAMVNAERRRSTPLITHYRGASEATPSNRQIATSNENSFVEHTQSPYAPAGYQFWGQSQETPTRPRMATSRAQRSSSTPMLPGMEIAISNPTTLRRTFPSPIPIKSGASDITDHRLMMTALSPIRSATMSPREQYLAAEYKFPVPNSSSELGPSDDTPPAQYRQKTLLESGFSKTYRGKGKEQDFGLLPDGHLPQTTYKPLKSKVKAVHSPMETAGENDEQVTAGAEDAGVSDVDAEHLRSSSRSSGFIPILFHPQHSEENITKHSDGALNESSTPSSKKKKECKKAQDSAISDKPPRLPTHRKQSSFASSLDTELARRFCEEGNADLDHMWKALNPHFSGVDPPKLDTRTHRFSGIVNESACPSPLRPTRSGNCGLDGAADQDEFPARTTAMSHHTGWKELGEDSSGNATNTNTSGSTDNAKEIVISSAGSSGSAIQSAVASSQSTGTSDRGHGVTIHSAGSSSHSTRTTARNHTTGTAARAHITRTAGTFTAVNPDDGTIINLIPVSCYNQPVAERTTGAYSGNSAPVNIPGGGSGSVTHNHTTGNATDTASTNVGRGTFGNNPNDNLMRMMSEIMTMRDQTHQSMANAVNNREQIMHIMNQFNNRMTTFEQHIMANTHATHNLAILTADTSTHRDVQALTTKVDAVHTDVKAIRTGLGRLADDIKARIRSLMGRGHTNGSHTNEGDTNGGDEDEGERDPLTEDNDANSS